MSFEIQLKLKHKHQYLYISFRVVDMSSTQYNVRQPCKMYFFGSILFWLSVLKRKFILLCLHKGIKVNRYVVHDLLSIRTTVLLTKFSMFYVGVNPDLSAKISILHWAYFMTWELGKIKEKRSVGWIIITL